MRFNYPKFCENDAYRNIRSYKIIIGRFFLSGVRDRIRHTLRRRIRSSRPTDCRSADHLKTDGKNRSSDGKTYIFEKHKHARIYIYYVRRYDDYGNYIRYNLYIYNKCI